MTTGKYYEGIGRRKAAVARVRLFTGSGDFVINERPLKQYFPLQPWMDLVLSPLRVTENEARFGVSVLVAGGGQQGQAEAVSLGVARALLAADEGFKGALRKAGLLTRDAREKERKKPGLKRARKAKQYTKR
ncbi:MAG: 30S ribosomal protein S9 [Chloroflexi bacterium]|nr:30S ribosomal protein S9 [Chloroflexota bacterium]